MSKSAAGGKAIAWRWLRLCLCLLIALPGGLFAPGCFSAPAPDFGFTQPFFETIDHADTIPHGIVTKLAQDRNGFIWIGTQSGLLRYDGYHFRWFYQFMKAPAALAAASISALTVAANGHLWIGSESDGLFEFNPDNGQFKTWRNFPGDSASISPGQIRAIADDAGGGIWVGTDHGLDYLAADSKDFVHFRHDTLNPASLADDRVRSLLLDKKGRLWVGSFQGLQRLLPTRRGFERIASDPFDPESLAAQDIQTLFEAADGKLWLGTGDHGAAWLQPGSLKLQRLPPAAAGAIAPLLHTWISAIAQPRAGQIWLATRGSGMVIVDARDGRVLQHLRHDVVLPGSLVHDQVGALLLDRSGLFWIATWGGGLQRHNAQNRAFRVLQHGSQPPLGLSHPSVRSVLELADGRILVGTDGNGIDLLDRKQGLLKGWRPQSGKAGALADGSIWALAQTADGSLWAGTQQAGLMRLAPGSDMWQAYGVAQGLPSTLVNRLLVGRDGVLWVGTASGLARWQAGGQVFTAVPTRDGQPMLANVNVLAEDAQGRIWVGSNDGLWVLALHGEGLLGMRHDVGQPDSLSSDMIKGLLCDSQGRLWVSTDHDLDRLLSWKDGVARFEHLGARFQPQVLNLGGNLQQDRLGRIWAGSVVLDLARMRSHQRSKVDGYDIGASWVAAFAATRDGLLLYGGSQGLLIVDPLKFQPWSYQPPVRVTEIKINGVMAGSAWFEPVAGKSASKPLLIPPSSHFSLEFAALDFSAPKENRYQYRLQGSDGDWIETDALHRNANYGNLWPGQYTLLVRGSNRDGDFNPQPLRIPIVVQPAFWQHWGFMASLVLLLGGYILYRWRRLRLEAGVLKQLIDARTSDILKLAEIGKELTSTLDIEQAFERVYKQVCARLDVAVFKIGMHDQAGAQIRFVYVIENAQRQPDSLLDMRCREHPAVWCVRERRELVAVSREGLLDYVSAVLPPVAGVVMETVVYLPLILEHSVIGCLSVQSSHRRAYNSDQLEFLHVLASYTAIALSNAVAHGELAQAHDELASAHVHLQETQQQMLLQEKMAGLGTLTAGVAHEINNPTNFAHVAAQNLRVDIDDFRKFVLALMADDSPAEIARAFEARFVRLQSNVDTMLNGTERIKGIVKDLRAFTRLDEAEKKSVRLSQCLNSTLNLVRTSWLEKVEFITEFDDDPEIECWPAQLNQVFMNLLVNGCQAIAEKQQQSGSSERGKLWLRLHQYGEQGRGMLAIDFEDNGVGIEPKVLARILEPFYTTKTVGSGTGLGLSIAFGIMKKHGGDLNFTSTHGVGSCFTVSLPLKGGAL